MLDVRTDAKFQQLVHSSKLPLYVKQFESVLRKEHQKRERFYEEMSEQDKVEFIVRELVEQYVLHEEAFELLTKSSSGVVQREALAGFEVPVRAIFDKGENLRALREITHVPSEGAI